MQFSAHALLPLLSFLFLLGGSTHVGAAVITTEIRPTHDHLEGSTHVGTINTTAPTASESVFQNACVPNLQAFDAELDSILQQMVALEEKIAAYHDLTGGYCRLQDAFTKKAARISTVSRHLMNANW